MIPLFFNCFANSYSYHGASFFSVVRGVSVVRGALKELKIKN